MEGVDHFIGKRGNISKVIMPHDHQQNANASCDVYVFYSFGHGSDFTPRTRMWAYPPRLFAGGTDHL